MAEMGSGTSAFDSDVDGLRVLIVCTGNICRSPVAEHLLRDAVQRRGHAWSVSSAGLATEGFEMHPTARAFLRDRQLDVAADWTSHALTRADIDRADLILTATRGQADAVVRIVPSAIMRVFPLRQFARLVTAPAVGQPTEVDTGRDLVSAANAARTRVATIDPAQDDIADPLRRSRRFFHRRLREIDQATEGIAGRLAVRVTDQSAPVTTP